MNRIKDDFGPEFELAHPEPTSQPPNLTSAVFSVLYVTDLEQGQTMRCFYESEAAYKAGAETNRLGSAWLFEPNAQPWFMRHALELRSLDRKLKLLAKAKANEAKLQRLSLLTADSGTAPVVTFSHTPAVQQLVPEGFRSLEEYVLARAEAAFDSDDSVT